MTPLELAGTPFPFGLTWVPSDVLEPLVLAPRGPVPDLVEACIALKATFAFVPDDAAWATDAVEALTDLGTAPMWSITGPLWPVLEDWGEIEGLRATLTDPERIGRQIDQRLEGLVASIARGARWGARAIVIAEDLAGSGGPLVAPDFAIAELLPRYSRIVRAAHGVGLPCVFHSDGDIRPLLPAIARSGFVAVHAGGGLGLEAFERLFWAAREAGLAVIGGLLTSALGNEARAEALGSRIGVLAQAGGLLLSDDGGITTTREVAALVAALGTARAS